MENVYRTIERLARTLKLKKYGYQKLRRKTVN